jgi:hypothetical protein
MTVVNISTLRTDIPRYPVDPYRYIRDSVVTKEMEDMYSAL